MAYLSARYPIDRIKTFSVFLLVCKGLVRPVLTIWKDKPMTKDGAQHLESLRDGREIFINGDVVNDVTTHPAFRNSTRSIASLYDFQAEMGNVDRMTFESPTSGARASLPSRVEALRQDLQRPAASGSRARSTMPSHYCTRRSTRPRRRTAMTTPRPSVRRRASRSC